jgi:hypothetical protein
MALHGFLSQTARRMREGIAGIGIGFALLLGALGQIITFVPGAEMGWFGVAAASALAGLLSRRWPVRIVAVVLAASLGTVAWVGYLHGLRYEEFLRQRALD